VVTRIEESGGKTDMSDELVECASSITESSFPEFHNIPANEWFTLKERFSEFSIQHDDGLSRGHEEFFKVRRGFYLRIFECTESPDLHDRLQIPRGLLHCFFNLRGNTELQIEGHGTRTVSSPALHVTYIPADCVLIESPVLHDQYRMFVDLLIDPEECLLEYLDADSGMLPDILEPVFSGEDVFMFHTFPTEAQVFLSLNQVFNHSFKAQVKRLFMQAKALELFCHVLDMLSRKEAELTKAGMVADEFSKMDRVRRYLDENFACPPTVGELAHRFAISTTKLKRSFKAIHGLAIGEYSLALRMHKAREMLQNNHHPISQIATILGYEHSSSFITAFKRSFGTTPRFFRTLMNKK